MKKTMISVGVASVVMMNMSSALASMSPELKVQGQMAVPSCEVSLGNSGVFDLGKIANTMIKPSTSTTLSSVDGSITVNCEADTYLNFTMIDNREGTASATGTTYFGLGNVNGTGKLGYYTVKMTNAVTDRGARAVYSAIPGSSSFTARPDVIVDKSKVTGWAEANNIQASGKKFITILSITPTLASSKDMGGPISDNVKLDGSATLNFAYGI
ncbi:DUF1120 domain-containing protein [Serratia sp. IR-2025]|nr:hypothetical protein SME23J_37000 [Serratia marcescens]